MKNDTPSLGETPQVDVLIVGTGIAGLTAGLLLQHSGVRVEIVEAHDKVGGCAGYFSAGEWTFPTGATALMGFENEGIHRQVFDLVGATVPKNRMVDGLKVFLPDWTVMLSHDTDVWRQERRKLGGNQLGQDVFWRLQEVVADAGWKSLARHPSLPIEKFVDLRRNLKLLDWRLWPLVPAQVPTIGEVMRLLNVHRDVAFGALVDLGLIITTQSTSSKAPFLNGAAGLDLWRHGAFHLQGGAGTLARYMGDIFQRRGGIIHFDTRVIGIEKEGRVWKASTTQGELSSQSVVWNGGLQSLQGVTQLPSGAKGRVDSEIVRCDRSWGAVNLYCAIKEEGIPSDLGLHAQVLQNYKAKPGDGNDVFLSLSSSGDEMQAPLGWHTLNVSTHTHLKEWNALNPKEYREQKRRWREQLLQGVRVAIPDFDDHCKFVICATPSTWEDYTHRFQGGVGGFPLTRRNANLRAVSSRVAPGLWCVGDSVFPGQGTVAAALSGFNLWRDVVGA